MTTSAHTNPGMRRRLAAEGIGTALLVAAVVGSGIMATTLTSDVALALLINAVATVAALGALIWLLAPVSGAHFNPVVTLATLARGGAAPREAAAYVAAHCAGAVVGVALANAMFALPGWESSTTARAGVGLLLGEVVATAGLVWVIGTLGDRGAGRLAPLLVPAWIGAAYFFTASTSFANPAVTLGRMLTDSFAGIAPASVLPFVGAQLVGAAVGVAATALTRAAPATQAVTSASTRSDEPARGGEPARGDAPAQTEHALAAGHPGQSRHPSRAFPTTPAVAASAAPTP